MANLPIRYLSILAFMVIVIWVGFAWYAGHRFEGLTTEEAPAAAPTTPAPRRATA